MVSFQAPHSPNGRKAIPEIDNSSKKRKWEEPQTEGFLEKRWRSSETTKCSFDIELHLDTPLPSEWQRCLDIQSGQIHFYNTRTQKRTSKDPRESPEPPSSPCDMSLDLELNLPCDSKGNTRRMTTLGSVILLLAQRVLMIDFLIQAEMEMRIQEG
ncbi:hypothetical protein K2173_001013 [Erythroxylum novogranatense]|uniref:WW domain-containing protein n=1 Tax=Erythroxylum novogranatense TaxID=1862640 RepID=A0AAV8S5F5_9ROSI|nr:hypothetical protein K2173_001013 [Erythroxylum novogranatense]